MTAASNAPQIPALEPEAANAGDAASLEAAHREVIANANLQFAFPTFEQPEAPEWLEPLLRFFQSIAPLLEYVFWGGVAIVVALILYVLVTEIIRRMPQRARKQIEEPSPKPEYRPAAARAKALLEEADRLAAQGRYGEAARVLLHRSIEDLERVFDLVIGPGLTSREIVQLDPLSAQGRNVFGAIARAVETSLFGGRDLAAAEFAQCREAYASFALQGSRR